MPYALYSTSTGLIVSVLPYQKPTNAAQLAAIAAQGMDFAEVGPGIGPSNSMIDLDTVAAIPTGPAKTLTYIYNYDTATGALTSSCSASIENSKIPVSSPGTIVSSAPLPLHGAQTLVLDADGNPTKDVDGNYVVAPPPPPVPSQLTQFIAAQIKAGALPTDDFHPATIAEMDAALTNADMTPITASAASKT